MRELAYIDAGSFFRQKKKKRGAILRGYRAPFGFGTGLSVNGSMLCRIKAGNRPHQGQLGTIEIDIDVI
jgi:hypothetical protein